MTTTNWQTKGNDGSEASEVIDFGLVDSKGRRIGTRLWVEPRFRWQLDAAGEWEKIALETFSYSIQSTRNGSLFGGIPRREGSFATIEEAKAAAEKAAERSRKSQSRKYGATVDEAKAKKAADYERAMVRHKARMAEIHASIAAHEAAKAAKAASAVEAAPAPAVEAAPVSKLDAAHAFVEAEAFRVLGRVRHVEPVAEVAPAPVAEVAIEVEVDPEVARFRGYRGPDGELRFRKVEAAPAELPRCRNCGTAFDPAVEGVADVFVACGTCRHGQLEPGEEPDCACHRDPALFA